MTTSEITAGVPTAEELEILANSLFSDFDAQRCVDGIEKLDDLAELSSDERQKKITAFIYNLERLLGMEKGSLDEVILPIFQNS